MSNMSQLAHSLERAWTAIRTIHHEVAPAIICVYRHPAGDRKGHFWANAWTTTAATPESIDEIHISSTILQDGALEVFHTLLHEAVHSIARTRGVQDTSRQGRYHNDRFRELAEETGLIVEKQRGWGYITINITDETANQFGPLMDELGRALTIFQYPPGWKAPGENGEEGGKGETEDEQDQKTGQLKATCPECGRIIRLSRKSWNVGPLICQPCLSQFELED